MPAQLSRQLIISWSMLVNTGSPTRLHAARSRHNRTALQHEHRSPGERRQLRYRSTALPETRKEGGGRFRNSVATAAATVTDIEFWIADEHVQRRRWTARRRVADQRISTEERFAYQVIATEPTLITLPWCGIPRVSSWALVGNPCARVRHLLEHCVRMQNNFRCLVSLCLALEQRFSTCGTYH